MSGEKPLGVTGGAPGPAGALALHLDLTGASIAAGGASQSRTWATADVAACDAVSGACSYMVAPAPQGAGL